jgi:hypothetical protein
MPCATLLTLSSCHYHPKTNVRESDGGREEECERERETLRERTIEREGKRERNLLVL